MAHIDIASMIGSAVPQPLRTSGHLACWYVMVDGVQRSGPFLSRDQACDAKRRFEPRPH
jgi:hypothetical protein